MLTRNKKRKMKKMTKRKRVTRRGGNSSRSNKQILVLEEELNKRIIATPIKTPQSIRGKEREIERRESLKRRIPFKKEIEKRKGKKPTVFPWGMVK
jgi:hypothetical protein